MSSYLAIAMSCTLFRMHFVALLIRCPFPRIIASIGFLLVLVGWQFVFGPNARGQEIKGKARILEKKKAPLVPDNLDPMIQRMAPGVQCIMLAEHPSLMTPTGIDVDQQGQIWLIACHTHFRPENYPGPEFDEVFVFDQQGNKQRLFYNKTQATMHIRLGSDGWVYLAERDRILRVRDADGDGTGDVEETLVSLDTKSEYPHNGLSGMAWHPDGGLVFSLGENFAESWSLQDRDTTTLMGRGEGGIFYCSADGRQLRRIAKGFWNPFGLLVREDGQIFAAENDPGSRPPCRLLHIVEGADYGYQRAYGNSAVHPFVAWNGELRGTLGMIHPSGEAPCAIVEFGGGVLIPSWSQHGIDYFPLHRRGASYTSERVELIRGSDNFRPVAMARGPDGSFYMTDWVFSSYELHQRGRLWKLTFESSLTTWKKERFDPPNDVALLADSLRNGTSKLDASQIFPLASGSDKHLADAALSALARLSHDWTVDTLRSMDVHDRLWGLIALRRRGLNDDRWIRALVDDTSPEIQFEVLRWIADGVLTDYLPHVEAMLRQPQIDYELFEAAIATWNTLRGNPSFGVTDVNLLVERLTNPSVPLRQKGFVLRMLPANHPQVSVDLLRELFESGESTLGIEVVRTLNEKGTADAKKMLAGIVAKSDVSNELRVESIVGLSGTADREHLELLVELAKHTDRSIAHEALRSLRGQQLDGAMRKRIESLAGQDAKTDAMIKSVCEPTYLAPMRKPELPSDQWWERIASLEGEADPAAGRRIFFNSRLGKCAGCHRYQGRGNVVGPELTRLSSQSQKELLLQSIVEPNRDVAPQYFATLLELDSGEIFSGILLRSSSRDVFRDANGNERSFAPDEIVQRKELKTSLMPTGVVDALTDFELRDLIAFLSQP